MITAPSLKNGAYREKLSAESEWLLLLLDVSDSHWGKNLNSNHLCMNLHKWMGVNVSQLKKKKKSNCDEEFVFCDSSHADSRLGAKSIKFDLKVSY